MKPVLVLENQAPERLAYLGTWLREHAIDVPHQQRQIGQPRLDHEVVLVAHQTPGQRAGIGRGVESR